MTGLDRRAVYWVDGPGGCPIGGPFDLWRKNYFLANGQPPADTAKMYPALPPQIVTEIATSTFAERATLDDVLDRFAGTGPRDQLTMAHTYFQQWRKRAPFLPESMQDLPLRPSRTDREPIEEFLDDWRAH